MQMYGNGGVMVFIPLKTRSEMNVPARTLPVKTREADRKVVQMNNSMKTVATNGSTSAVLHTSGV
jgi:hypothetical protein